MAEFADVSREESRLCENRPCLKCPLSSDNNGFHISCSELRFSNPLAYEKIVMEWAAKNPIKKYPTWFEWLEEVGIVRKGKDDSELKYYNQVWPTLKMFENMSKEDAMRFGVKPKEN